MAALASSSSPWPPAPAPPAPEEEEKASFDLWYVGAIINVVGSISINLGMNLMKLGHTRRAEMKAPEEEKPPVRKIKVWIVGVSIFVTGNVLNFVSFAFAAQSLLAALGSLQVPCNVFFAYLVNRERVTKLILLSTLCIIGGCVLLVVFGNQGSETYTVKELMQFYTLAPYVVYLVMMGVFMFGFYIVYLHAKKVCSKRGQEGFWYIAMLVSYSIFSALLGSQSVLFGKSISVILRTTFEGSNQLGNWYTWVVLPIFTFTALFWVTRLNKGLRMFPAMIIVPLLQIAWTLFSIVSGMIYFQEYKGFNTIKAIMFPVGVLVVFFGVFLLTVGRGGEVPPLCEEALDEKAIEQASAAGTVMTVHENAVYMPRRDGSEGPPSLLPTPGAQYPQAQPQQPKISLGQTLRFMSTWAPASVAVSPGSVMGGRTLQQLESLRRHQEQQRRGTEAAHGGDLNATGRTNRTDEHGDHPMSARSVEYNSTLNKTAASNTSRVSETPSMMGTMRKGLKSVHNRITSDLGVDTKSGLKLAMGLGDSGLTGVSVFTMPTLDFTATKPQRPSRNGGVMEAAIINALPRSKFYKVALPTAKDPGSDLGASLTASSNMRGSSYGGATQTQSPPTGHASPETPAPTGREPAAPPPPSLPSPPPPQVAPPSPSKPLDEAAMLNLLPGPSFGPPPIAPPLPSVDARNQQPPTPTAAPAASRSRRPSGPQDTSQPLSSYGPGWGARGPAVDPGSSPPPVQHRRGGSGGAAADGTPGPGGRSMQRPVSLVTLPEGVPLSTANSIILHESRPSTPPELMVLAGAGSSGAYQNSRLASPQHASGALPSQQHSQQFTQQFTQQQQQLIPLSLLQRAQMPPTSGVRMPALHLMVPGMSAVAPPPLLAAQSTLGAGGLHFAPSSGSYAQLLGQMGGSDMSVGPVNGGGLMGAASLGGPLAAGGSPTAVRVLQPRQQQSPLRGLSVSRSWAGMGGSMGGAAVNASRQSPLRGSLITHMQKPLRPWQY
ncbi:hypothetical protein GPECTOR_24g180 [Gonium pectorale]|uniref:Magnesium transporter n=1 Tax=Gonium pectorale TaxID=33097 RepID=A0A150GGC5_GONPE|nr:hypothetical protein GPECTOR_24g180 [Gonium pectorale]|eukprot:KXZ48891.1 hypothetical protein GPECTOR_24g180 [Gonium pectorale]